MAFQDTIKRALQAGNDLFVEDEGDGDQQYKRLIPDDNEVGFTSDDDLFVRVDGVECVIPSQQIVIDPPPEQCAGVFEPDQPGLPRSKRE